MKVADRTQAGYQAEALKTYLIGHGYPDTTDEFTFRFIRWNNGRENAYAMLCIGGPKQPCLVVVFGEHRNCDSIFVDHWMESREPADSEITNENIRYEEAYRGRETFGYGRIDQALSYIHKNVDEWLKLVGVEKTMDEMF